MSAETLDASDPLVTFRSRFSLPDDVVYLDGNSLGPPPAEVASVMRRLVEGQWGAHLISGWDEDRWMELPAIVGDLIAPLIGAGSGQVVVADSTTVNLYKLLMAAMRLRPGRTTVVADPQEFPTDLHVAAEVAQTAGGRLVLVDPDRLDEIGEDVAVVVISHVNYRTGRLLDMGAITDVIHRCGALAVWDLSHSAGAVEVDVAATACDMAVGCGYKYLNGGPGAPAFLYVAPGLIDAASNAIPGWLGSADPFTFAAEHRPAAGIGRMLSGTPPVLALQALRCGVELVAEAGVDRLRRKSLALTDIFIDAVDRLALAELEVVTPRDHARRGSQVSLRHPDAAAVVRALKDRGVVGDFRTPDVCRFGFAPLYLRHVDAVAAADRLGDVLAELEHGRPRAVSRPDR